MTNQQISEESHLGLDTHFLLGNLDYFKCYFVVLRRFSRDYNIYYYQIINHTKSNKII